jgi:IS1 family transposase
MIFVCIPGGFLIGGFGGGLARRRTVSLTLLGLGIMLALIPDVVIICLMLTKKDCEAGKDDESLHSGEIVTQKYLTKLYYCNTVLGMANILPIDKQIAVIGALAEGSSIRSIERLTGIHRDTIMRLGVKVGRGCEMLLDSKMQDLSCNYLQMDEVWGFIGKKERHCSVDDNPELGDVWTYCAIDSETKLVPAFKVGKRTLATTTEFVHDVANRMRNRVQISTDALRGYAEAIEQSFGADVDYGQIVKVYTHDGAQHPERKYSAPSFASALRRPISGDPERDAISTSHVERLNATTRLHVKRLSRLTLAFSKRLDNFKAAVGLHFAYYNLVRRHATLRCTPAMAAGVEKDFWTVGDLVEAVS